MNSVNIIGRLTKDPEIRYTQSQMAVARFTVAVDRYSKGEKSADFIPVTVFDRQAENCEKYIHKGSKVGVSGSIKTGRYEKEGTTVYTTDVVANHVEFLDSVKNAETARESYAKPEQEEAIPDGFAALNEDVPF